MGYCSHCGGQSDDGLEYCPYCGKRKSVVDSGERPKRRLGTGAIIAIYAIVGACAATALILTFFGSTMGIQVPWFESADGGVAVPADERPSVQSEADPGTVGESGDDEAREPSDTGRDDAIESPDPVVPQSVTGVASGDAGWPYGDSSMLQNYEIRSSSTLDPQTGNTYVPTNVADNNVSTCWAEGVSGLGEGEWLSFENVSGSTQSVSGIEIVNGYGKEGRFETNTTPVRADLYVIDGSGDAEKVAQLTLMALDAPQLLEFSPSIELAPGESLRLTITESRLMSDGADPDACISEVRILS